MFCCAALSSGGVSLDLEKKVGLSREPSFTILGGINEDDTLQLVMQPSRNAKQVVGKEAEKMDPKKLLHEAS